MAITGLFAFVGVSLLIIVTPGQDTLLTVRNTLNGGRAAGWFTALGVAGGQLTWTLAASAGLGAALVASPSIFTILRLAGAAYLVWLGGQSAWAAITERGGPVVASAHSLPAGTTTFIRQGLLSNLGNPKMLVFFTGLLPQFGSAAEPAQLVLLGLVFCLLTLCWLDMYVYAIAKLGALFGRPTFRRTLEGAAGAALILLGARIAADVIG
jgi:threonine/homoserine/homoserine lactone efflux protein